MNDREFQDIESARERWEAENAEEFRKERKREFSLDCGIPLRRVYTPVDLAEKGFDYLKDVGLPGEYPYTRGISPTMYRGELWRISQYSGHPTPEDCNRLWKAQISAGGNVIYIAYDLPSQLGYDPDNPRAEGEVGRVGVSLTSQRDWEIAFDGIDIAKVAVFQVFNAPAVVGVANHICLAKKQGLDLKNLQGVCQSDILKEYEARGNYIFPPGPSMRLVADLLSYCGQHMPNYQATQACALHQAEMGANAIHEVALGLASAFEYIKVAVERGIDVDIIAPGFNFLVTCDPQGFFEEIAKLRAMRRIFARVLKERFKAKRPESMKCKVYAGHGGMSVHREQYLTNIARAGIAGVAAALAGAQQIDLRPYDEQFGIPTKEAIINSIRVQHIIARETGIADTVDPLAGSYFVEWLTSEMEKAITKELETIDGLGGVVKCIENGYIKRMIAQDAYKWQRGFEAGEMIRVGVNYFTSEVEEKPAQVYRADPRVEKQRIEAVKQLKKERANKKVKKALDEVKEVALMDPAGDNNIMPAVIQAVDCYATVGEICDVLREVWGEYDEPSFL